MTSRGTSDRALDADVLVVGGGPAGLAVALELRARGLSCLVVDRGRPPLDKACGEGLMPDGRARLEALGVRLADGAGHPFHGIRYVDQEAVAEGRFPGDAGLGVRRTALHEALVERAEAVGVELRWRTRVVGLEQTERWATLRAVDGSAGAGDDERSLRGRLIVGADGLRSKVRTWAGLDPSRRQRRSHQRFGVRRHLRLAPWHGASGTACVEVHWADGCEAYVTPVAADEIGVAMLWSGETATFDALLPRFPQLAARLDGALQVSRDRGCGPLLQRVRGVARGRIALVGDASGYVDAITGEGLSLALHHAAALAEHYAPPLARADVDLAPARRAYARAHACIGRLPWALTHLLLALERRPALRRRAVRALAAEPSVFERFLAVHVRDRPVRHLGAGAPRLLHALLRAG